jgi:predicted alpha/beta-fold hydrolase
MIFRSCGTELNRTRRSYHSGETTDLAFLVDHFETRFPHSPLLLAGVSLGGNVLLKYLGEQAGNVSPRIKAAAAVSVPFDLARSSRYIDRGFSKVYQQSFLRSLNAKARIKLAQFPDLVSRDSLHKASTMFEFDDCFTAPVHGFRDAMDYYGQSSSIKWIERISTKTLLLSAVDDPFLPSPVLDEVRLIASRNPNLELDFPLHGGHVGFVSGRNPFNPVYYLEQRVSDFLAHQLEASVTS